MPGSADVLSAAVPRAAPAECWLGGAEGARPPVGGARGRGRGAGGPRRRLDEPDRALVRGMDRAAGARGGDDQHPAFDRGLADPAAQPGDAGPSGLRGRSHFQRPGRARSGHGAWHRSIERHDRRGELGAGGARRAFRGVRGAHGPVVPRRGDHLRGTLLPGRRRAEATGGAIAAPAPSSLPPSAVA